MNKNTKIALATLSVLFATTSFARPRSVVMKLAHIKGHTAQLIIRAKTNLTGKPGPYMDLADVRAGFYQQGAQVTKILANKYQIKSVKPVFAVKLVYNCKFDIGGKYAKARKSYSFNYLDSFIWERYHGGLSAAKPGFLKLPKALSGKGFIKCKLVK